jgi:hypothetical protein
MRQSDSIIFRPSRKSYAISGNYFHFSNLQKNVTLHSGKANDLVPKSSGCKNNTEQRRAMKTDKDHEEHKMRPIWAKKRSMPTACHSQNSRIAAMIAILYPAAGTGVNKNPRNSLGSICNANTKWHLAWPNVIRAPPCSHKNQENHKGTVWRLVRLSLLLSPSRGRARRN